MMKDESPSNITAFLAISIPFFAMFLFVFLLVTTLETLSKNNPSRLRRGDEIIVITDHGQYILLFYTENGYLKCTDKEGKIHFFRGNYEYHQRSELSPEVVDSNDARGDFPPLPQSLLR